MIHLKGLQAAVPFCPRSVVREVDPPPRSGCSHRSALHVGPRTAAEPEYGVACLYFDHFLIQ